MSASTIIILGSYNTDLTTFTPRIPQPGETILGHRTQIGPGGKGSNQAIAAARLGGHVLFIGRVGQDSFGQMALDLWQQDGIDTRHVIQMPENHTGMATILVDDAGENMIVVASGANMDITPADIDRAEGDFTSAAVFLTQLETPIPAARRALELARQHGVTTILNPAPGQKLPTDLLALVDFITPNQTEAEIITGQSAESPEDAAAALLELGVGAVLMTLGSAGSLLVNREDSQRFPSIQVEVVDTTGAGDAFNGGFAVALAEGKPLPDAIRFATTAAALSVTRPGAAASMATRQEVEKRL